MIIAQGHPCHHDCSKHQHPSDFFGVSSKAGGSWVFLEGIDIGRNMDSIQFEKAHEYVQSAVIWALQAGAKM
jgi:hypothetical protein